MTDTDVSVLKILGCSLEFLTNSIPIRHCEDRSDVAISKSDTNVSVAMLNTGSLWEGAGYVVVWGRAQWTRTDPSSQKIGCAPSHHERVHSRNDNALRHIIAPMVHYSAYAHYNT